MYSYIFSSPEFGRTIMQFWSTKNLHRMTCMRHVVTVDPSLWSHSLSHPPSNTHLWQIRQQWWFKNTKFRLQSFIETTGTCYWLCAVLLFSHSMRLSEAPRSGGGMSHPTVSRSPCSPTRPPASPWRHSPPALFYLRRLWSWTMGYPPSLWRRISFRTWWKY